MAQAVSVIGDKLDQIALAILVYQKTGSMLQMGIVLGITTLPAALFAVIAGVFVDRWDRRMTMIGADLARAVLVLSVPFVAERSMVAVYAIAFAVATVSLFFEPARLALIPELVPEEELMTANSLDEATMATSELLGLAIGGGLVALIGWQLAFYVDALTFVGSAIIVFTMRHRDQIERRMGHARHSFSQLLAETLGGLKYLGTTPVLRDLTVVYALTALAGSAMITLAHLLALYTFEAGSLGLATLDGAITVGLVAGSLLVGRSGSARPGLKFLLGVLSFGVLMIALALFPSYVPALALLMLSGAANMLFQVPAVTILQEQTIPKVRGRVFAARTAIIRVAAFVGLVGGGALADRFGVVAIIYLVGATALVAAAIGFSRPALRTA